MTGSRKGTPTAVLGDRRSAPRIATSLAASVTAGRRTIALTVENLSVTGARLVGPMPMTVGQRLRITFALEGVSVDVLADVVRVQTPNLLTDRVAVHFVDMCARSRAAIAALVARALGAGPAARDGDDDGGTGRVPWSASEVDLDAATARFVKGSGSDSEDVPYDTDLDVATVRYVKKKGSA